MSQPRSQWRRHARQVIAATLAALPADATPAERRRALKEAYPYGLREHHPYRMWCAEVRLALGGPGERKDAKSGQGQAPPGDAGPLFTQEAGGD